MQPHSSAHLLQMHAGTGVVVVHVQVWHHRPQDGPPHVPQNEFRGPSKKEHRKKAGMQACEYSDSVQLISLGICLGSQK